MEIQVVYCINIYKSIKKDILNLDELNIQVINNFFSIIDKKDCGCLKDFPEIQKSLENISDYLDKKFNLSWINLLIDEIFNRFTVKEDKESLFKNMKNMKSAESDIKKIYGIDNCQLSFFICIFMLFAKIKKVQDVKLLEEIISKINEKNDYLKEMDILIFWMTIRTLIKSEEIQWETKKHLFWNWNKNPYFNFFTKENFKELEHIYTNKLFSNNEYAYIYNFVELLKSIKNVSEDEKECFRKKILGQVISSLNKDIKESLKIINKNYFGFNELLYLQNNLRFNLANADFLNNIIKNIIPIKKEDKKKLEEVCFLYDILKGIEYKEEIEISKTESPDFIIKRKNNKKIGIELTRIESEKEHQNKTDYHPRLIPIDRSGSDLIEQITSKIRNKFKKCEEYNKKKDKGEFDKLWLSLHFSIQSETFIKALALNNNKDFKDSLTKSIEDLKNGANNCFDDILCKPLFWVK